MCLIEKYGTLNIHKVGWVLDVLLCLLSLFSCCGLLESNYFRVSIKSTAFQHTDQNFRFIFHLKCSNQQSVASSHVTQRSLLCVGQGGWKLWVVLMRLCSVSFSRGSLPSCFRKTSNHSSGSCPPLPPHLLNIWTLQSHLLFFFCTQTLRVDEPVRNCLPRPLTTVPSDEFRRTAADNMEIFKQIDRCCLYVDFSLHLLFVLRFANNKSRRNYKKSLKTLFFAPESLSENSLLTIRWSWIKPRHINLFTLDSTD